jgi:hypothetical protein
MAISLSRANVLSSRWGCDGRAQFAADARIPAILDCERAATGLYLPYARHPHTDSGWRRHRVIWHNDCLSANWAPLDGLFRASRNRRVCCNGYTRKA